MNTKKQIDELNEEIKCTLMPSPIHGIGVFALRDLKEGEKLFTAPAEYKSYNIPFNKMYKLRPEIYQIVVARWPHVVNGFSFESPNNVGLMSFMNHAEEPNSEKDVALRDIKSGEEVTENYRLIPNYKKVFNFL